MVVRRRAARARSSASRRCSRAAGAGAACCLIAARRRADMSRAHVPHVAVGQPRARCCGTRSGTAATTPPATRCCSRRWRARSARARSARSPASPRSPRSPGSSPARARGRPVGRPRRGSPPGCSRGIVANVVIGRMPFTLGRRLRGGGVGVRGALDGRRRLAPRAGARPRRARGVLGIAAHGADVGTGARADGQLGCRACAARRRRRGRLSEPATRGRRRHRQPRARGLGASRPALLAFAATWASPVAGVFLCIGRGRPAARRRARGARRARRCSWRRRAWPAARDRGRVPGGRPRPLRGHRVLADARALRCGARSCSPRARATVLRGRALYLALLVAAFASRRRSARTRCGPASCSARRCSCSSPAARAARAADRGDRRCSSTCSGCRRCARSPRRTATRRRKAAFHADARCASSTRRPARRARRGAAHAQPLGGGVPRAARPARARLAPPARPQGQPALLRRRPLTAATLPALAARRRGALGRAARTRRSTSPPARRRELLRAACRS